MTSYNNTAFVSALTHAGVAGPSSTIIGLRLPRIVTRCTVVTGSVAVGDIVSPRASGFIYSVGDGEVQMPVVAAGAPSGQDSNGFRGVALEAGSATGGEKIAILWQGAVTVKAATSTAATSPLTHDRTGANEASLAATGEGVWGYALTSESGGTLEAMWCCLPVFGTKQ